MKQKKVHRKSPNGDDDDDDDDIVGIDNDIDDDTHQSAAGTRSPCHVIQLSTHHDPTSMSRDRLLAGALLDDDRPGAFACALGRNGGSAAGDLQLALRTHAAAVAKYRSSVSASAATAGATLPGTGGSAGYYGDVVMGGHRAGDVEKVLAGLVRRQFENNSLGILDDGATAATC